MDIAVVAIVVPIVLAIFAALWALSSSNIRGYRRLKKALDLPLALILFVGFGILIGACLAVWKVGSGDIFLIGGGTIACVFALHYLIEFFDWLNGDKADPKP